MGEVGQIRWTQWDGDRAYQAEAGDYRLTTNLAVTRGDVWFWCVRHRGRQVIGGSGDSIGPEAAMRDAELVMNKHAESN